MDKASNTIEGRLFPDLGTYLTITPMTRGLDEANIETLRKLFRSYGKLRPVIDLIMKYESKLVEKT